MAARISAVAFLFLTVLFVSLSSADRKPPPPEWMLKTLQGAVLVLHADSTWSFKDPNAQPFAEDFTVPVNNGKIVLIKTDNTWAFVKKELVKVQKKDTTDTGITKVTGSGTATNIDAKIATDAATKTAIANTAGKIQKLVPKRKLKLEQVTACVQPLAKNAENKPQFVHGKGWQVTVSLTLEKDAVKSVMECASDTTAAMPPPATPAVPENEK